MLSEREALNVLIKRLKGKIYEHVSQGMADELEAINISLSPYAPCKQSSLM